MLSVVTLPACLRVDALRNFVVPCKWLVLVAIESVLEDEVSGEFDQILDRVVDHFSWPPHNLLFDSRVLWVLNFITKTQVFSRRARWAAAAT